MLLAGGSIFWLRRRKTNAGAAAAAALAAEEEQRRQSAPASTWDDRTRSWIQAPPTVDVSPKTDAWSSPPGSPYVPHGVYRESMIVPGSPDLVSPLHEVSALRESQHVGVAEADSKPVFHELGDEMRN